VDVLLKNLKNFLLKLPLKPQSSLSNHSEKLSLKKITRATAEVEENSEEQQW